MEYEIERMQPEDVREVAALEAKIFLFRGVKPGFSHRFSQKIRCTLRSVKVDS